MGKGDEADAKQRYNFAKILGKIKKCGEEPNEASEAFLFMASVRRSRVGHASSRLMAGTMV